MHEILERGGIKCVTPSARRFGRLAGGKMQSEGVGGRGLVLSEAKDVLSSSSLSPLFSSCLLYSILKEDIVLFCPRRAVEDIL